jgi:hypothetical protein
LFYNTKVDLTALIGISLPLFQPNTQHAMTRRHSTPSTKVEMARGEDILVEDGLAIVNTEPYRPTDDAMDWSVDDVVRKLCEEPSLLPQTLNLPALAQAFRKRGITGRLLLCDIDSKALRVRWWVLKRCSRLQQTGVAVRTAQPTTAASDHYCPSSLPQRRSLVAAARLPRSRTPRPEIAESNYNCPSSLPQRHSLVAAARLPCTLIKLSSLSSGL